MAHPWMTRIPNAHPPDVSVDDLMAAIKTIRENTPRLEIHANPEDAPALHESLDLLPWAKIEVIPTAHIPRGTAFVMDAARIEALLDLQKMPPAAMGVTGIKTGDGEPIEES